MPITYPRTIPSFAGANEGALDLTHVTTGSRTRGGSMTVTDLADPFWDLTWTTGSLRASQKSELSAWWSSLRGGGKTFLAYHPGARWPAAYALEATILALTRAGGGAFNGTASITSFPDARTIAMSSAGASRLPAGFQLSAGDMVSIVKPGSPNRYSLHRVVEAATADGTGQILGLLVEPFILTSVFAAGNTVNFIRALGEFVPDQERWSCVYGVNPSPASFGGFSKV
jgi:hypothetical protein